MTARTLALAVVLAAAAVAAAAPIPKASDQPGPATKEELRAGRKRMAALVLALHAYIDDHNGLWPTNVVDGEGKVLLSWRVQLLPYLGEEELYKRFDLTESWDGKTNRKLIEQMPDAFAPARDVTKNKGETFYQGFDGRGAAFDASARLKFPGSFPDGTSNTIALVEAGEPVIWTKPADIAYDSSAELPKLGGVFDGEFWVGLCDGSVWLAVTKKLDAQNFHRAVTTADGFVVDMDSAFGRR